MEAAYDAVRSKALKLNGKATGSNKTTRPRDWRTVQRKQFLRLFGAELDSHHECTKCQGPVSEAMLACPWCGKKRGKHTGDTKFPRCCPRCWRGMKLDWVYCPWCYGAGFEQETERQFSDKRYTGKCTQRKMR